MSETETKTLSGNMVDEETFKQIHALSRRTQSRIVAFQIICEEDANPKPTDERFDLAQQLDRELIEQTLESQEQIKFAGELVRGIRLHLAEIDALIAETARNWSMTRMELTDRNVLRLGAYELKYTKTPTAIVINEAVEIAKTFGTQESGTFVNGILDRIAKANPKQ